MRFQNNKPEKVIAIAGNPNVGKSTLFNELTGLHQHTGNWTGKTVANAWGRCRGRQYTYLLADIPGTYSLLAHSAEEELARNLLCFEKIDACMVVCDATCLERGLNLLFQVMEIVPRVLLCVNLMDEARRKKIEIDLNVLGERLKIPVIGTSAHNRKSRKTILDALDLLFPAPSPIEKPEHASGQETPSPVIPYDSAVEKAILTVSASLQEAGIRPELPLRWISLQLLLGDASLLEELRRHIPMPSPSENLLKDRESLFQFLEIPEEIRAIPKDALADLVVSKIASYASRLSKEAVRSPSGQGRGIDRILTGRILGYPLMVVFLLFLFWITIVGSNYPSQMLFSAFSWIEERLNGAAVSAGLIPWLRELLVYGVFRTVSWIVSVMLPPMAIFFPLFTLLEDIGYLPRIAFNLDYHFQKCRSCGKQALTMAMGFGCNAAGVVGCRIIDSPRDRLIAILTNSFVPCNGRFPTLITMISLFLIGNADGSGSGVPSGADRNTPAVSGNTPGSTLLAACCLTALILFGILMTFLVSRILSATLLKGEPSSFILELPPFRRPRIGKVVVRSILDRTLSLLSRAVVAAVPAGLLIWLAANVTIRGETLLSLCCGFLDPFARLMGLDGTILMAFILGLPANEIVLPIILMAYSGQGFLQEMGGLGSLKAILTANGWNAATAVSVCLFSLMHWPCATTLLTIRKETGSLKWTLAAILIPLSAGVACCILFHSCTELFALLF